MNTNTTILETAQHRASENNLPYQGTLTPQEAYALLQNGAGTKLVDVRSRAELDWVGRVPGAVEVEWATYPGMIANPQFLTQLAQYVTPTTRLLFLCRSGARSNAAAILATQNGYANCYNILEGFEGDKDTEQHRNMLNGWRAAGLPWVQG